MPILDTYLDKSKYQEMLPEESWFYLLPILRFVTRNNSIPIFIHRGAEPFQFIWDYMVETLEPIYKIDKFKKASNFSRKFGNIVTYSLPSQISQMLDNEEKEYIFTDSEFKEIDGKIKEINSSNHHQIKREIEIIKKNYPEYESPFQKEYLRNKSRAYIIDKISVFCLDRRMILINDLTRLYNLIEAYEQGLNKPWKYNISAISANPYDNFQIDKRLIGEKECETIFREVIGQTKTKKDAYEKKKILIKKIHIIVRKIKGRTKHNRIRDLLNSILKSTYAYIYFQENTMPTIIEERALFFSTIISAEFVIKAFNPQVKYYSILAFAQKKFNEFDMADKIVSRNAFLPIDLPWLYKSLYITTQINDEFKIDDFMVFQEIKGPYKYSNILEEIKEKRENLIINGKVRADYKIELKKIIDLTLRGHKLTYLDNKNYLKRILLACLRRFQSENNPNEILLKKRAALRSTDAAEALRNEFNEKEIPYVVNEIEIIKGYFQALISKKFYLSYLTGLKEISLEEDEMLLEKWNKICQHIEKRQKESWDIFLTKKGAREYLRNYLSSGDKISIKAIEKLLKDILGGKRSSLFGFSDAYRLFE